MKKVIIIDDDKFVTDDLVDLLEFEDIKSQIFSKPIDFIKSLTSLNNSSCVVLDIMMRRPDGYGTPGKETGEDLYKTIRESKPNIPVLVISAKNKSDINIDFDDINTFFIKKPFDIGARNLIEKIENL